MWRSSSAVFIACDSRESIVLWCLFHTSFSRHGREEEELVGRRTLNLFFSVRQDFRAVRVEVVHLWYHYRIIILVHVAAGSRSQVLTVVASVRMSQIIKPNVLCASVARCNTRYCRLETYCWLPPRSEKVHVVVVV